MSSIRVLVNRIAPAEDSAVQAAMAEDQGFTVCLAKEAGTAKAVRDETQRLLNAADSRAQARPWKQRRQLLVKCERKRRGQAIRRAFLHEPGTRFMVFRRKPVGLHPLPDTRVSHLSVLCSGSATMMATSEAGLAGSSDSPGGFFRDSTRSCD